MRQWENAGQDEESLLRGVQLGEAENWFQQRQDELSQAEQGFIHQSLALRDRDRQQKERRRKLTLFGLTGGLLVQHGGNSAPIKQLIPCLYKST
jgi:hypothetical protein